jgi:ribonuclease Z
LHGDHIFGLPGLLGSRSFQGGETNLTVYGPKGIKEFIDVSLRISKTHLRYPLEIIEIEEGTIFEDDQIKVEARVLEHGITSYGYRVIEKDLPGTLQVDKLKEVGIHPGPLYKKLKQGEKILLEDGRTVDGNEFIGPKTPGRIITILGDTRITEASIMLANGADVLVHEATFSGEEEELAHEYYHSSTLQAAKVAMEAKVKQLILTHISSRYQKDDVIKLQREALHIFQNVVIAHDLYTYTVERRGKEK